MSPIPSRELAEVIAHAEDPHQRSAALDLSQNNAVSAQESMARAHMVGVLAGRQYLSELNESLLAYERLYENRVSVEVEDFVQFESEGSYTKGLGVWAWNSLLRAHQRNSGSLSVGFRQKEGLHPRRKDAYDLDLISLAQALRTVEKNLATIPVTYHDTVICDLLGQSAGKTIFDFLRAFVGARLEIDSSE